MTASATKRGKGEPKATGRIVLSSKLRPIGRPTSRFTPVRIVQTRVPDAMYRYCKTIQPLRYETLMEMFDEMLTKFRAEKPWDNGLMWRKPKTALQAGGKTGWKQININMEEDQKVALTSLCEQLGVSSATFCYTAIYWWIEYVNPPFRS